MFTAGPQVLFRQSTFWRKLSQVGDMASGAAPAAASSVLYLGAFGFALGLGHGLQQALASAVKIPLLVLLTLLICLPLLQLLAAGFRAGRQPNGLAALAQLVAVVLPAVCAGSFLLLMLSPIVLYAELAQADYEAMQGLTIGLMLIAGSLGMLRLMKGMRYTQASAPLARSDAGVLVLVLWGLYALLVGLEVTWRTRPFIGKPAQAFTLLIPTEEDVVSAAAHAFEDYVNAAVTGQQWPPPEPIRPATPIAECVGAGARADVVISRIGVADLPPDMIAASVISLMSGGAATIWVIDPNHPENSQQLTHSICRDTRPIWSPDRSKLFFVRHRTNMLRAAGVVQADGSGLRQVTGWWDRRDDSGGMLSQFWYTGDPRGERIYYMQRRDGVCRLSWAYADGAPTQDEHRMSGVDDVCYPDVSPDLRSLVFLANGPGNDLQIADLSTTLRSISNPRTLFPLPADMQYIREPAWSPDGSRLAFSMAPGENLGGIYTIAADGSDLRPIFVREGFDAASVDWSPDGDWLIFTMNDTSYGRIGLGIVPSDGSGSRLVTLTAEGSWIAQPSW